VQVSASVSSGEVLSPELVLVDPGLAAHLRVHASDRAETGEQLEPEPIEWSEKQTEAALRRIEELAKEDERLRRGNDLRVAKLSAALASWIAVSILAADLQLWRLVAI
jgi:hypothetical protein